MFSYHSSTKNVFSVRICEFSYSSSISKKRLIDLLSIEDYSLFINLDEHEQTNYYLAQSINTHPTKLFKLEPTCFFTLIDMYNNNKAVFYKEIQTIEQGWELVRAVNLFRQKQSGSSPPLDM